jgi:serine/threonine protein kinase
MIQRESKEREASIATSHSSSTDGDSDLEVKVTNVYQNLTPAEEHTVGLSLSDIEIVGDITGKAATRGVYRPPLEERVPEIIIEPVRNSYTPEQIYAVIRKVCEAEGVYDVRPTSLKGGQGHLYKGFISSGRSAEDALVSALSASDPSLKGAELRKKLKVQAHRDGGKGPYVIDSVEISTDEIPLRHFIDGVDRKDLPESYVFYGNGDMLALEEQDFTGDDDQGLLAKAFKVLKKMEHGGSIRLNPWTEERILVKAITHTLPQMIFHELHTHLRVALATDSAPDIMFIQRAEMPNGTVLPIIGMEYVDGLPLETYAKEKNLSERDRLKLFGDVIREVGEVHTKAGMIHRDLKPDNVFVTPEGKIKILDYGLATEVGKKPLNAGIVAGTPHYCSPEHIEGTAYPSMDIYSLGVMLHELLLGEVPHKDTADELDKAANTPKHEQGTAKGSGEQVKTPDNLAQQILQKMYQAMHDEVYLQKDDKTGELLLKGGSEEIDGKVKAMSNYAAKIIITSLRYNPEHRYQSCEEFANAIDMAVRKIDAEKEFMEVALNALMLGDKGRGIQPGKRYEIPPEKKEEYKAAEQILAGWAQTPEPPRRKGVKGIFAQFMGTPGRS